MKSAFALGVSLFLASVSAGAQEVLPQTTVRSDAVRFRQLGPVGGTIELAVGAIYQDDIGFIWFGTEDGLFRYDGYDFQSHRPIPFDSTSVSDPWVNDLANDGRSGFWLSTQSGGLNHYEPRANRFARYGHVAPSRIQSVVQDAEGFVWVATGYEGLVRFDYSTGEVIKINADPTRPSALPSDRLTQLFLDSRGVLWIGTAGAGVCRFDRATGRCSNIGADSGLRVGLPSNEIEAFAEDGVGRILIGTAAGLARFDPNDQSVTQLRSPDDQPGANYVRSVLVTPDQAIWIGNDAGLDRLDSDAREWTHFRHSDANPVSIARGSVYSLLMDRTGVIWAGTDTGVSYFEWNRNRFQHVTHLEYDRNSLSDPEVWAVYEDTDGVAWVGTSNGLNRIDRSTGAISRFYADRDDPTKLLSRLVMGIGQLRDGTLWVGTRRGGLHFVDRQTGLVLERFAEEDGNDSSLHSDNPWWILEDRRGRVWITSGGRGCLSQMLSPERFKSYCHDPSDPNTPSHDFAREMIEGGDGTLWLATWGGGLDRIDPETLTFTHYRHDPRNTNTPSSNFIISLYEDAQGVLWLATYGAGFSRFDPVTGEFRHYTSHNSELPSDTVYEIQPDNAGNLWLSTNGGLMRFNVSTETFRAFGLADGIQNLEFNSGASFRSTSGELYFGGVNGINVFRPDEIVDDRELPKVVMTSLQAGGREIVQPGANSPIALALPFADTIRLRPEERDISIGFAALHYVDPSHNRYRYRLDGYDDDWHDAGYKRSAVYTNLDPGDYVFRVSASNSDGEWNESGLAVKVLALPFWYETSLAKLLYGLLIVLLLRGVYRYHRNRLVLQHRLEIEHLNAEKLRELDKTRSLFFANISHEFRTPLTLTLGPVDDVLAGRYGDVSTAARDQLGMARRNAARVLDLINQILDVARLEAGRTRLRARRLDLLEFVQMIARNFLPMASRRAMVFDCELPAQPLFVWFDPIQMEKVISNLLSNAFKFTRDGGTVRITVSESESVVMIAVRDSGSGIAADELPHVFERFHQASNSSSRLQPGTGIGLSLSREIVELHRGRITVSSEEGFGSTFVVSLPLGREHLSDRQIDDSPAPSLVEVEGPSGDGAALARTPMDLVAATDTLDDVTTVLIVEDNPELRSYISSHLAPHYRVIESDNGRCGLAKTKEYLPDLVLSDVMMPDMDGYQLCREIKNDPEIDFIPVILLTAKAAHEDLIDALREQADAYVAKPFDPVELLLRIENLIGTRRQLKNRFSEHAATVAVRAESDSPEFASPESKFLARALEIIQDNLSDETLNVERLAELTGVSRAQLFRNVRAGSNMTPSEMIRDLRLTHAASLLENRVGNVSEVAYATGFKSLSHFSRSFTTKFGCKPSVFADRSRRDSDD